VKIPGRKWSRTNVLTGIGAVAGLLVIPLVAIFAPSESASNAQEFVRADAQDLDPNASTCLAEPNQVIPAGATVCALLGGSWLDGSGPRGVNGRDATAIWTRQAHPPFMVLTSPLAYQHSTGFHETTDFVVCVQPPRGGERSRNVADRMQLAVMRSTSMNCAVTAAHP
jgi:hypothetical protein